jgi:hypothetical protein
MSALAHVVATVEAKVAELVGVITGRVGEQDARLDALEARVTALEAASSPAAKAAPARPGARKGATTAGSS